MPYRSAASRPPIRPTRSFNAPGTHTEPEDVRDAQLSSSSSGAVDRSSHSSDLITTHLPPCWPPVITYIPHPTPSTSTTGARAAGTNLHPRCALRHPALVRLSSAQEAGADRAFAIVNIWCENAHHKLTHDLPHLSSALRVRTS